MDDIICIDCNYIGKPRRKKRGSGRVEFMGWMMFPLGIPYTIWRILARTPVCRHCGSESLLPVDSIGGQRLMKIVAGESVVGKPKPLPDKMPVKEEIAELPQAPTEEPAAPVKRKPDPNSW